MSSIVLVDQHLPLILRLASRVNTCARIIIPRQSFLALLLIQSSSHIVTAVHNLTSHHHHNRPQDDTDSYSPVVEADNMMMIHPDSIPVIRAPKPLLLISVTRTTQVEVVKGDIKGTESYMTIESSKKKKTFKQDTQRDSVVFGDIATVQRS
ncbi:hypothetical protein C0995_001073 [Termitomyces sp. Mi166|nr:hypothetical protein C0995_001073 [Termitomyces sp. Mi166\